MEGWRLYVTLLAVAAIAGAIAAVVLSGGQRFDRAAQAHSSPSASVAIASSAPSTPTQPPTTVPSTTPAPTASPFALATALKPVAPTRVIAGTTLIVARSADAVTTTLVAVPVTASPAPGASGTPLVTFGRNGGWQLRADGQVLAVSLETAPDSARIATWNLRSGAVGWLTPDEPGVRHATPVWAADGSLLYYESTRGTAELGFFRIRADGTAPTLIRKPDGKAAGVQLQGLTPDGAGLIWSYTRAGGSADVFDLQSGTDRAFDDSTAASILAFRVSRPRALVSVGGGAGAPPRQLNLWDDVARSSTVIFGLNVAGSPDGVGGADWDPTGTRIAVAAFTNAGTTASSVLITTDGTGGAKQTVTGSAGAEGVLWFRAGIAYTRRTASGGTEVMLIQPAGGTPVMLFADPGPLGARLTFVSP